MEKSGTLIKEGAFPEFLKVGLIEISRSLLKELKIPSFMSQFYVLGFVVNFWMIFGYIWE